jgi:hypothetical protein
VPKSSLPVRLALLVAGTTLPLIIFATVLVFNEYEQDRRDASQRVLETVHSIRLVLDAEVQRMTGGLQVLTLTDALRNGDFENFRRIASGFLDQYGPDGVVLVSNREGRQLFSSMTTNTASLPMRYNRDIVEKVFATKSPAYSNLFIGAVKKRPIMTVEVPVLRDGDVLYDISFSPPISIFQTILKSSVPAKTGRSLSSMATPSISRAFPTRTRPSASAHRRRCMPRCFAGPKQPCRRYRSKAYR